MFISIQMILADSITILSLIICFLITILWSKLTINIFSVIGITELYSQTVKKSQSVYNILHITKDDSNIWIVFWFISYWKPGYYIYNSKRCNNQFVIAELN
jgi:hypothetical protein